MSNNLNPAEAARQENLKKLLDLLRKQPADPDDRQAVWREYGPVKTFLVIFMGLFITAYLLVMIPTLRLLREDVTKLLYWEVDTDIYFLIVLFCTFGVGLITFLLTLRYTQKVFHSRHHHKAVAALDDWKMNVNLAVQKLRDDLYSFEVLGAINDHDFKVIKLSHADPDTVAKLEVALRNHDLGLEMTEQFAECANANIIYKGDVLSFRRHILTRLDRIAPRDNRPDQ